MCFICLSLFSGTCLRASLNTTQFYLDRQPPDIPCQFSVTIPQKLFLYQKLINDTDLELQQDEQRTSVSISGQTFKLYPFNAANKQEQENDKH